MEDTIQRAEAEVVTLEAALANSRTYREGGEAIRVKAVALEASRKQVERLYSRWTELGS